MSVTGGKRGLSEPASDLVSALRRLHLEAGRPSARAISKAIGIASHTTVAEALAGKRIPSRQIVSAIVKELGGDEVEFQRLWMAAADRLPIAHTAPRQLPPDTFAFTGRERELEALDQVAAVADRSPTVAVISAIDGMAGIGKTALAVHWAHRVSDRFPDGQLYLNLRGFDPTGQATDPGEAIQRLLDALTIPAGRIPTDLDARAALLRSVLAGRRILMVLDDARDASQIRPLLPGTPTAMVIVTSRSKLTNLVAAEGALPLTLDVLTAAEARAFLASRVGPDRIAAEPEATEEIIARCARLPLALSMVAARAATHPHLALATLADELVNDHRTLDALGGYNPSMDLRSVFSWSYHSLPPDAARLFRLLGVYFMPDISVPTAASLAAVSVDRVRPLLTTLAQANLITEHAAGRYSFHDLLRVYAHEHASSDADSERRAATHRLLDYYLHTAHAGAVLLVPHRNPITLATPEPGTTPDPLVDYQQAMAWFNVERANMVAAIDQAAADGLDNYAWQLAWTLEPYLHLHGGSIDQITTQRIALAAAERMGDALGQAQSHRNLSRAYTRLGRFDDAQLHLRHALQLATASGDQVGQAQTYLDLAAVLTRQARHAEALDHAERALSLYRTTNHQYGQANALNMIGWSAAQREDYQQALDSSQQALALYRTLADSHGQAEALDYLGYIHHRLAEYESALTIYEQALRIYLELGDRFGEAEVFMNLGDANYAVKRLDTARDAWRRALSIFTELDHPEAQTVQARLAALDQPVAPI